MLGIATLIFSYTPSSDRLDGDLFRFYAHLLPEDDLPVRTATVAVDDLTDGAGGPVSFHALADLIDRLGHAGASGIGVLFPLKPRQSRTDIDRLQSAIDRERDNNDKHRTKAWRDVLTLADSDSRLESALHRAGRVVLAAGAGGDANEDCLLPDTMASYPLASGREFLGSLQRAPLSELRVVGVPGNTFIRQAAAIGADCGSSGDGGFPLLIESDRQRYPTFLLQLLGQSGPQRLDVGVTAGESVTVGYRRYATGPGYRFLPHPSKQGSGTRQPVFAGELLAGKASFKRFKDQYVLIGYADLATTPAHRKGLPMAAVARDADAMLEERYYTAPPWRYAGQRLAVVGIMIYLLLLPSRLRGLTGLGLHLFMATALLNVTFFLMLSRNTWFPMTLPVVLILGGGLLLLVRDRIAGAFDGLRLEAANAYRELARTYQSQGQLDFAFEYLSKCPVDGATAEPLYNLGMEFERRRQFGKAMFVYERIARRIPKYRDIAARREKLSAMPAFFPESGVVGDNSAMATMLIEDAVIARPVIGRYQIERELGRGAMGMVYLGSDPKIGRTVAIKTLALANEFDGQQLDEVKRRFYQEAETAGQLNHPNIVTIYDVGEEHDLAYIAMDYVRGKSLAEFTDPEHLLPLNEVVDISIQIAGALEYAHAHKVVHRDVKPANIIYDRDSGRLKVTDFGIACLTDNSKTRTRTVLGSPFYMSPEQVAGNRVDGRSDLYSLGVTLYQLLSGQLPFVGDSLAALMYQIAHDKPAGLRKLRGEVPVCLARIVARAIEKDVDKRPQSGQAFVDALYDCAEKQRMTAGLRVRREAGGRR